MEQQQDLEELVNLKEDDESNNESDSVIPGPNCLGGRGLRHWRHAVKLLGFVVMVFCLALLVFWRSSILTSKRMEVQKEISTQHQMEINGGRQDDHSSNCNNCNYYSTPAQKPQKHPEIADTPAADQLCQINTKITLPVTGSSQWKKLAAMGGTYCGPLLNELPQTPTVGHAWLADGAQYVGPWKHGEPDSDCQLVSGQVQCHGDKGTFYYANGTKKHGYWHGTAFCSDDAAVSRKPQCITDWGLVKTLEDAEDWIESVAVNDQFLAAGGQDKKVRIYSTEDWKLVKTLEDVEDAEAWISSLAFNDMFLAVGAIEGYALGSLGQVRIYSIEDWKLVKTLEKDLFGGYHSVAFHDQYLAAGGADHKFRIYYKSWKENWKLVKTLEVADGEINSVAFNDKFLAAGGDDKKVRIYSIEDWKLVKTLEDACAAAFTDKFLAAVGYDLHVRIYSIEDWKLVKTLDYAAAEGSFTSVAVNDKYLAAVCYYRHVRIYSIEEWKLVKTLDYGAWAIKSVAFNDKFLAAGGLDKKVRIYYIEE